ncbi:anti-sigma factor family protein [Streptomyces sp. NPDC020480]|uniref:anti-sigma factor family protein n=1 Tax=Streptomyces sp. NPDC020480 TaxID=3365076 RepID=UPI0037942CD2
MSSRWWMWWRSAERGHAEECLADGAELQSYLDGELDAPEARRVRAHVARCHRCARELAAYQRITNALASRGAREGPDEAALGRLRDLVGSLADQDPSRGRTEERPQNRDRDRDLPRDRTQDLAPEEAPLPPGEPDASESAVPKAGA